MAISAAAKLVKALAKTSKKKAGEWDEAAWITENPHPVKGWPERHASDFSPDEKRKHAVWKTRKSKAKRVSSPEGRAAEAAATENYHKALRDKYQNNPDLFDADYPRPHAGVPQSQMTPAQKRDYSAWVQMRGRAGLADSHDLTKRSTDFDMNEFVRVNGERPHSGIKIKDMTPEQEREYNNWKTRLSRARKNPEALEEMRRKDAEAQQAIRDARTPEEAEEYKAWLRQYRKDNPEITMESDARKRAQRMKRLPSWQSDLDRKNISEIYDVRRLVDELTGIPHHVDHVIPLQGKNVSGLHTPDNLLIVPARENMSKKAKFDAGDLPPKAGIRNARALLKKLREQHGR